MRQDLKELKEFDRIYFHFDWDDQEFISVGTVLANYPNGSKENSDPYLLVEIEKFVDSPLLLKVEDYFEDPKVALDYGYIILLGIDPFIIEEVYDQIREDLFPMSDAMKNLLRKPEKVKPF